MTDKAEAIRAVLADGGEMTSEAVAGAVKARFGIDMKPGIVAVIRASFRWQDVVVGKRAEAARLAEEVASRPQEKKPKGRKKKASEATGAVPGAPSLPTPPAPPL